MNRLIPISTRWLSLVLLLALVACGDKTGGTEVAKTPGDQPATPEEANVQAPAFNADSAYAHVEKQVSFGPRVPGSDAHSRAAQWLIQKFRDYGAQVSVQEADVQHYSGKTLNIKNIIASYKPEAEARIMLSAHWDTRPIAEEDLDPNRRAEPIPGANDGASGVAVLMEIARQLQQKAPNIGVDLFLWDAEDWGDPSGVAEDSWALGSQYWARNPHKPGYTARWGINLDMVGAKDATFLQEPTSLEYAPQVVDKVWRRASELGHGDVFLYMNSRMVLDDHTYINQIAGIPMIDIIHT
ncbi:MAG: M28 family peptidase, partial [Bacteroidota bacterium]